ncbi:MAG: DUF2911 domain-containing protein [Acidobacteria bacterium]|nr:DUF2911 domain-containing protein [Acidobacteriota bacterium]
MLRALLVTALLSTPLAAQGQRVSPHEQAAATIDAKKITIEYGRPYMKGRKIFGGLEKYGTVWRAGADEATKLTTEADLTIAGLKVPKGSYALFVLLQEPGWKLIVNTVANQWGAFKYDQARDLGRVDMKTTHTDAPLEQFTISITPAGPKKGTLKMAWENTVASVDFTVN